MSFFATSAALCAMAVLDGLLCGFRAAAGRDGRIDKRAYYRRAMVRGAAAGARAAAACAGVAIALWALAEVKDRPGLTAALDGAGRRALTVYVPYGAVAVASIVAWLVSPRGRTLSTVVVLGPFTLARPAVIVAGLVAGVAPDRRPALVVVGAVVGVVALTLERRLAARSPVDAGLFEREPPAQR